MMQIISRTEIINDTNLLWCLCIIQMKPETGNTMKDSAVHLPDAIVLKYKVATVLNCEPIKK